MIKKCPECNRTYSDESISFCLADGALLSPPYQDSGTPTMVMPGVQAPSRPVQQTPTIAAPPLKPVRETRADSVAPSSSGVKRSLLAIGGLLMLVLLSLAGYRILTSQRRAADTGAASNSNNVNGALVLPSDTQQREATKPAAEPSMATTATPREREKATPTPLSKGPDKTSVSTPTPAAPESPSVDYSKIFSGREVTQNARILSKPSAGYTESARQNGVSGVVVLRIVLAASGEVTNITVLHGLPDGLSEQAIAAARKIKFEPAMKDGRAVSQYVQIEYNFSLY